MKNIIVAVNPSYNGVVTLADDNGDALYIGIWVDSDDFLRIAEELEYQPDKIPDVWREINTVWDGNDADNCDADVVLSDPGWRYYRFPLWD